MNDEYYDEARPVTVYDLIAEGYVSESGAFI